MNDRFGHNEELEMEFPCNFPIKVVGRAGDEFRAQICNIAQKHDQEFVPEQHLQIKDSSQGKYQSLTLNIKALSKEQINAVYQDLKACESVLWAL
jgi:hypothetical protein